MPIMGFYFILLTAIIKTVVILTRNSCIVVISVYCTNHIIKNKVYYNKYGKIFSRECNRLL